MTLMAFTMEFTMIVRFSTRSHFEGLDRTYSKAKKAKNSTGPSVAAKRSVHAVWHDDSSSLYKKCKSESILHDNVELSCPTESI